MRHLPHRRRRAAHEAQAIGHRRQRPVLRRDLGFDALHDGLGFVGAAMRDEPAWALGDVAPHQQDRDRQQRPQREAGAPAPHGAQHARVEQHQAQAGAQRGADPEAAVDRQVDAAAHPRGDEFVDGRVDGRVLAADAHACHEAAEREEEKAGRESGREARHRVDRQRDEEQLLAPPPVGQPAEHQRPDNGASDVERARAADLRGAQAERVVAFEHAAERADQRDLQPVEHPGDAQRDHHAPVPAGPGQAVEAGGDVGVDGSHRPGDCEPSRASSLSAQGSTPCVGVA